METLKPQGQKTRLEFVCRFLARTEFDDAWPWEILLSDETHFYLDGAVNSQKFRILSTSPLNVLHPQPLHSVYVTAWFGFTDEFLSSDLFVASTRHFPDAPTSRSPDINPFDFWLWGFLKDRVNRGGIGT
ncbi:uncharacterized protein TNCV_2739931 [Trichonephila clavipes]|nr:uncharacterized protein TNCV_2739931 [Trichonephila clavipes]